jgi:hypothetical protein
MGLTKYNWSYDCIDSIDWQQHGYALASITGRQLKTTIQLIHKWLPINTSHSLQAIGTGRLCPYCQQTEETHQHLLSCQNTALQEQWTIATQEIRQKITKYSKLIHPTIIQLIILGITEWRTTPTPTRPEFVEPQFHALFQQQSQIGWQHIINGRFSKEWTITQNQLHPKTPSTWLSYTIRLIWKNFYCVWKHRCSTNHGSSTEDKRKRSLLRITPKVQQLYDKQQAIDPSDTYIFETPISY